MKSCSCTFACRSERRCRRTSQEFCGLLTLASGDNIQDEAKLRSTLTEPNSTAIMQFPTFTFMALWDKFTEKLDRHVSFIQGNVLSAIRRLTLNSIREILRQIENPGHTSHGGMRQLAAELVAVQFCKQ